MLIVGAGIVGIDVDGAVVGFNVGEEVVGTGEGAGENDGAYVMLTQDEADVPSSTSEPPKHTHGLSVLHFTVESEFVL